MVRVAREPETTRVVPIAIIDRLRTIYMLRVDAGAVYVTWIPPFDIEAIRARILGDVATEVSAELAARVRARLGPAQRWTLPLRSERMRPMIEWLIAGDVSEITKRRIVDCVIVTIETAARAPGDGVASLGVGIDGPGGLSASGARS